MRSPDKLPSFGAPTDAPPGVDRDGVGALLLAPLVRSDGEPIAVQLLHSESGAGATRGAASAAERARRLHRRPAPRLRRGGARRDGGVRLGRRRRRQRPAPFASSCARRRRRRRGSRPGSNVSAAVPCLSAGDWARLLLEAAGGPHGASAATRSAPRHTRAHRRLNRHQPRASHHEPPPLPRAAQSDSCLRDDRVPPASGSTRRRAGCASSPPRSGCRRSPSATPTSSSSSSKRAVPDDAKALLEKWLAYDIQTLQYPKE